VCYLSCPAAVISILRDLAHKHDWHPVSVLFTARNPGLLFYADEVSALKARLKLHVDFSVDEPPAHWSGAVGPITAEVIDRTLPAAPARCLRMICGPTPMVLAAKRHSHAIGVPRRNIVYERFEYD
jgi:ferredoxin-NADP reductase